MLAYNALCVTAQRSAAARPKVRLMFSLPNTPHNKLNCPSCQGRLYRVPRHFFDVVISKFTPVRRYRCFSVACCWEGTLRYRQTATPSPGMAAADERRYIL